MPQLFEAQAAMPSLLEAVGEVLTVRLTVVDLDNWEMTLELRQDGRALTEIKESLELRPEGWQVGGQYSLRGLGEEAAGRALQAAGHAQQAAA